MADNLRDAKGRMLAPLAGAAPPITSDNAREMVRKRVEKYRRAALKRIIDEAQSIDPDVSTAADAFGLVASKQYVALMDSNGPKIGDLAKMRDIMTGNEEKASYSSTPNGSAQISAEPSALVELASLLEREIAARVQRERAIDGDAK